MKRRNWAALMLQPWKKAFDVVVRNEINKKVKYNSFIVIGLTSRQAKNGTKKQLIERETVLEQ